MNAYEIIESANYDLDHNKITLGEWEKRIEPTKNVTPIIYGKWIVKTNKEGETYGECSVCNKIQYAGEFNFCPYCGADMKRSN